MTCGIGSMLVGARQAGFDIVGNIEWRRYYHKKDKEGKDTFTENFPGVPYPYSIDEMSDDEVEGVLGCDLAIGHPECGNFSNLGGSIKDRDRRVKDPCDIPLFIDLVGKLHPRFFVMDDLPKSLGAFTMAEYHEKLPGYDLYPEWIANHGYGNVQRGRKRMFMIGSLRSERWTFRPGEADHDTAVKDVIDPATLVGVPNHVPHSEDRNCQRASCLGEPGRQWAWREVAERFLSLPIGTSWPYLSKDGEVKARVGFLRTHWDKGSHVLTGYNAVIHPLTGLPLSIRERARIQGFPDDFVFYSEDLEDDGTWEHFRNIHLVKQTGKAMPVQFCRYVSEQIAAHLRGVEFKSSGVRLLRSDRNIDEAKRWYCSNVGYSDQRRACSNCWLYEGCSIRTSKYGIDPGCSVETSVSKRTPLKVVGSTPASRPAPRKPKPTIESAGRSTLHGKRPGVGKRMKELIEEGVPPESIVEIVRREFPGSSANLTDVAKVRSNMSKR